MVITGGVMYVLVKTGKAGDIAARLYNLIKKVNYFPVNTIVNVIDGFNDGNVKGADILFFKNEKISYLCTSNPMIFQKVKHTGIFNEHIR